MTIETNIKTILGEMSFQMAVLQTQLQEANIELEALKAKKEKNEK